MSTEAHDPAQHLAVLIVEPDPASRWVSKPFLDILREHVLPRLHEAYQENDLSVESHPSSSTSASEDANQATENDDESKAEARALRRASASVALVCSDWAAVHRQAEQGVVQARLWDAGQVGSLGRFLRRRQR
ncbi:hypothetical protein Agub_g11861, partial [Astrephomene gubernaculifera]